MRYRSLCCASFGFTLFVCLCSSVAPAMDLPSTDQPVRAMERSDLGQSGPGLRAAERTDTIQWGSYTEIGGRKYAVLGETWTWDHGLPDPFEGWTAVDHTADPDAYFRWITAGSWAGHGNEVPAPILNGNGSVWVGLFENEADSLCWSNGLGYGNQWCQRLDSPQWTYGGSGSVALNFSYFNDSEQNYDYSHVFLILPDRAHEINEPGFSGRIGTPPSGPFPAYSRTITQTEMGGPGERTFQIRFEFTSDGGWSDEDGYYDTTYGPFGADDVVVSGDVNGGPYTFDFEAGLDGWTASRCPGIGSFFGVHPLTDYTILDACGCGLSGNVIAWHNPLGHHPEGQHVTSWSPPADRTGLTDYNRVFAEYDEYSELPMYNGVFARAGWSYFPYLCASTGQDVWSPRVGDLVFYYVGDQPDCQRWLNIATDWGVPSDCQMVKFAYEVYASCDEFFIPTTMCTGETNVTPLVDNVRILAVHRAIAPEVAFEPGGMFQDGFPQTEALGVTATGNADSEYNRHMMQPELPDRLGDSLVVKGPSVTTSSRWEARLFFRVPREGPGQVHIPGYGVWKNKVSDGLLITGPRGAFAWGWMDSVETGSSVARNKFDSYFREGDDDYTPGPLPRPDINEQNEIIRDGILTPGTKIQYFVTANYTCYPTDLYYLPDTTGGNFLEFEILPSYRTDGQSGYYRFPCLLSVLAGPGSNAPYIESALNLVLNQAPSDTSAIPDPTLWDRYDYHSAASSWRAPLIRNAGGNAGATVAQLLGYRTIMVNTGDRPSGTMTERDWRGFEDWLGFSDCEQSRHGFAAFGSDLPTIINDEYPAFLSSRCGAAAISPVTGLTDGCLKLVPAPGCPAPPAVDLDLVGSACLGQSQPFDLLGVSWNGQGALCYTSYEGADACLAEVWNDRASDPAPYRTVLGGFDLTRLTLRSEEPCEPQTRSQTVQAMAAHLGDVLSWLRNGEPVGLCVDPCLDPLEAPESELVSQTPVTRLVGNHPNPFSSVTSISFSLARGGRAKLLIHDVSGRLVRTVVDGVLSAGPHVASWDGCADSGARLASGVYWSRLEVGDYASNRRMLVLK